MNSIGNWLRKFFPRVDRHAGLRKFEVFTSLNAYHLHLLNSYLHQRDFKAGEMIYEKGFPLETVLFVEAGEVEIFDSHQIDSSRILISGDIIGLVDLFSADARTDHAKARTDLTLFAMSKADMHEMIRQNRELGTLFLIGVCAYLSKKACAAENGSLG